MSRSSPEPTLFTTHEAASYLRLDPLTLKDWRRLGAGPPYVKVGARLIRYRRQDLEEWLADNLVMPS
jgi:excisionase family DNA binding protein